MNHRTFFLKVALALCLVVTTMRGQVQNGLFTNGFTSWKVLASACNSLSPTGSALGNMSGGPDFVPSWADGNQNWVDLTGCGYGNGRWISQNVGTVIGKTYLLEWVLGCASGDPYTDAGVNLDIDGITVPGRFAHTNFDGNPQVQTDYLRWKRFKHCFVATDDSTEIKFTGNAAQTSRTPPWADTTITSFGLTYIHPKVIGLDSVSMTCIEDLFQLVVTPGSNCNQYCLSLAMQTHSLVSYSNVNWYVDNVLESSGNSYCRYFPQGQPRQVKVEFTITTPCGPYTRTLQTTVTAENNCPCIGLDHTFTSCSNVIFNAAVNPGFNLVGIDWTLNGALVPGSLNALLLNNLPPGQHIICARAKVTLPPETDTLACTEQCIEITVPPPMVETVRTLTYCPFTDPAGPEYMLCQDCIDFEYWENGQIITTSANGCVPYVIKPTSEIRCYTTLPGNFRCESQRITFNIQAMDQTQQLADEIVYLPCQSPSPALNFPVTCGSSYELIGPNGYNSQGASPTVVPLLPGVYIYTCYDNTSCIKTVRNLHVLEKIMTTELLPSEIITAPCGKDEVSYNANCGLDYEIYGPNGYFSHTPANSPYEPVLAPGFYSVNCIDLENCITYTKLLNVNPGPAIIQVYAPDETVYIECTGFANAFPYPVNCGSSYSITGPGGYFSGASPAVVPLPAGDYEVKCLDPVTCQMTIKTLHVIQRFMIIDYLPDETVYIPCGSSTILYDPNCGPAFEIHGPGGFFLSSSTMITLPQLSAGDYNVYCIDAQNCHTYIKVVHVVQTLMVVVPLPATSLTVPCGAGGAIYNPGCNTSYSIVGSNGFTMQDSYPFISFPVLPAGSYSAYCADYENCILYKTIVEVGEPLITESSCTVTVPEGSCDRGMFDPASTYYFAKHMDNCPDCKATVENATSAGPWITMDLQVTWQRTITREYYDAANCKKCTITLKVPNPAILNTYEMQEACHTFSLPACLQNTSFKMFIRGFPESLTTVGTQTSIMLCCENAYNVPDPLYVMYSEDDPCCFYFIHLACNVGGERRMPTALNTTPVSKSLRELSLVPNPTSSVFRIVAGERLVQFDRVDITDMDGKTVLSRTQLDSDTYIDAGKLARGVYMVHVTGGGIRSSLKLVLVNE